jgi:hypothetical protein
MHVKACAGTFPGQRERPLPKAYETRSTLRTNSMMAWRVNATDTRLAAHEVQTPTLLAKENALRPLWSANEVALIQDKDTASGLARRLGAKAWRKPPAIAAFAETFDPPKLMRTGGGRGSRIRTCDLQYPKPRSSSTTYRREAATAPSQALIIGPNRLRPSV